MKHKLIALMIILSYPCSLYGLSGVQDWIIWPSVLLPFVSMVIYIPFSFLFGLLFSDEDADATTMMYLSFVFSLLVLLCLNPEADFIVGRLIMWFGGTLLYIDRLSVDRKKRDEEVKGQFYRDLKSGKIGIKEGYIL